MTTNKLYNSAQMEKEDLVLVGFVAAAHAWQLGAAATEVAVLRRKHKISPPITDGPPDFIRALRAQQNGLEFGVMFEVILWTAGIFGHQVPAAALGCYYLVARHFYVKGYIQDAEKRKAPFYHSVRAVKGLLAVSLLGMGNIVLRNYANVDVVSMLKVKFFPA
ncbi:microsomal glutathione S-transferase 2-like [Mercenaria mercenaria]|uniref:microsomal glutathione S-transferase 2-like n=1 Tax=Mercenaria mercenaria TaxID=6596 RepID=UPI00234F8D5F|nr:microsomal glutathione S-transferase 2-like [Mercenaria mercenaria]